MLNNLHMSAHMMGKALDGDDLLKTTYEIMVKIQSRLVGVVCICVYGVMFLCHYVLSSLDSRLLRLSRTEVGKLQKFK